MFNLGFFYPRRKPLVIYEGIVLHICRSVFWVRKREEIVWEQRGNYNRSVLGCISYKRNDWIFLHGCSLNQVNHVYMCLSCFMCFMCLYFYNIFYVFHCSIIYNFLTSVSASIASWNFVALVCLKQSVVFSSSIFLFSCSTMVVPCSDP